MKEFWKTGLAVLVLAALGSYVWFYERKQEPKREGEREKVTMLTVDKAKATGLTLSSAGAATIELQKQGDSWALTAPFAAPADGSSVDSLLSSLEKLEADEVVAEQVSDFAQYGLDSPGRKVQAKLEGQEAPLAVEFGAKSPDGGSVYARKPGEDKVYLVASWVEGSFEKKPFDLRDRDLLKVKRDDVRSLEVAGPEGGFALTRTDAGEWAFTRPVATRAGRWSVDGLLGTVESLRMDSVAGEDVTDAKELARYGLARPSRSVTLVTKDGDTRTLEIGGAAPDPNPSPTPTPSPGEKPEKPKPTKYYARKAGSGLVAVVPAALADDLAKGMGELRAKRLAEIATYDTEGFEVQAGGVTQTYAKSTVKDKDGLDKTEWKRTAPDQKDLETSKVEDVLYKLGGLEASQFIDAPKAPAEYGLEPPALTVKIKAKSDNWVEIGQKDGSAYARRMSDSAVLKLDAAKAEELIKDFQALGVDPPPPAAAPQGK